MHVMARIVIVTVMCLTLVMGLTDTFEQECHILQTLEKIQTRLDNAEARLQELSLSSTNKVAFMARLQQSASGLGYRQTIVFDNVVTNLGNCYSATTGIFTAKSDGTFFFFTSVMSKNDGHLETRLIKNGDPVANMYSFVRDAHDQGVNGAVVGLTEGDTVWVRLRDHRGDVAYGDRYSTFMGFQIL